MAGIVPERLLEFKLRYVSDRRLPREEGIVPRIDDPVHNNDLREVKLSI
jgi:hypothetical protein